VSDTSSSETAPKTGNLGVTVGTWLFILHTYGHELADAEISAACAAIQSADEAGTDDAGKALVALVDAALGEAPTTDDVRSWLTGLLGESHVDRIEGSDRADRTHHIRAYQFRSNLPFIAHIIDRFPDGTVGGHWVMVERVTDTVTCMDPYPWDDLDEEYTLPVVEFMVKWELAGCESILFRS